MKKELVLISFLVILIIGLFSMGYMEDFFDDVADITEKNVLLVLSNGETDGRNNHLGTVLRSYKFDEEKDEYLNKNNFSSENKFNKKKIH